MKTPIYHTGWYIARNTAVFQFCQNKDNLSCEIVEYCGRRETTKKDAIKRLKEVKSQVINELRLKFPKYNIKNIIIER